MNSTHDQQRIQREVAAIVARAMDALDRRLHRRLDDAAVELAMRCSSSGEQRVVLSTLISTLTETTARAWERGWQPADLHRLAAKRLSALDVNVLHDVMSHELSGYAPTTIDRQWRGQLSEMEATVWWPSAQTFLDARRQRGTDWLTIMTSTVTVLHLIARLPTLECLGPLPGQAVPLPGDPTDSRDQERPAVDERILSRVRQLLAKAESTTFEAEAETFTAGAQALMARHSIDEALLAAHDGRAGATRVPHGRRIGVETPYDAPKAMLLNAVASANHCRMVWSQEYGFGTIIGYEADLETVEVLFTSLLVQATRAMTAAGSRKDGLGNSRTRSFRHSFLVAYAGRIGERLEQVTAEEVDRAAAEIGSSGRELVPILAQRAEEVSRATREWFPAVSTRPVSAGRDAEGWHTGRAAADRAQLGSSGTIGRAG